MNDNFNKYKNNKLASTSSVPEFTKFYDKNVHLLNEIILKTYNKLLISFKENYEMMPSTKLETLLTAKISQLLSQNNIVYEREKTFPTCIYPDSKRFAKFDFYSIEFDFLKRDEDIFGVFY